MKKKLLNILACLSIILIGAFALVGCGDEPSSDNDIIPSNAIQITNTEELISAINNQQENQYWVLNAGTYDIDPSLTTIEIQGDLLYTGWYFPIVKNNITIHGKGNVVLTSSVDSVNAGWPSQNFITVMGDGFTLKYVTVVCKKEVNKAIEIVGKNTTIKNVVFDCPDNYDFAGSIYLNQAGDAENTEKDFGTLILENVKLNKGRITASGADKGKVVFKNVSIDWTEIDPEILVIYPIQNFNITGKQFIYEGVTTLEVKISESELGDKYEVVLSNIIEDAKIVNIDD